MIRSTDNRRVPTIQGRDRRWALVVRHDDVLVVNYLMVEPGEQVDDTPPEVRMSRTDWARRHAEFGLTVDGRPLDG